MPTTGNEVNNEGQPGERWPVPSAAGVPVLDPASHVVTFEAFTSPPDTWGRAQGGWRRSARHGLPPREAPDSSRESCACGGRFAWRDGADAIHRMCAARGDAVEMALDQPILAHRKHRTANTFMEALRALAG